MMTIQVGREGQDDDDKRVSCYRNEEEGTCSMRISPREVRKGPSNEVESE